MKTKTFPYYLINLIAPSVVIVFQSLVQIFGLISFDLCVLGVDSHRASAERQEMFYRLWTPFLTMGIFVVAICVFFIVLGCVKHKSYPKSTRKVLFIIAIVSVALVDALFIAELIYPIMVNVWKLRTQDLYLLIPFLGLIPFSFFYIYNSFSYYKYE